MRPGHGSHHVRQIALRLPYGQEVTQQNCHCKTTFSCLWSSSGKGLPQAWKPQVRGETFSTMFSCSVWGNCGLQHVHFCCAVSRRPCLRLSSGFQLSRPHRTPREACRKIVRNQAFPEHSSQVLCLCVLRVLNCLRILQMSWTKPALTAYAI